jgi:transposase
MLKDKSPTQYQLEMVAIDQLVPQDHLVRLLDATIDFEFIRDEVKHLYCSNNGRPATDPVRFFKILFLGYLFGIPSERRLVKEIEVNVAYRWFLEMGLTDDVINHSTLSQNRIKRFKDSDIYQRIFDNIVLQAMTLKLIGGHSLFADSTHLKANANKRRYDIEDLQVKPSAYIEQLNEAVSIDREQSGKKPLKSKASVPKTKPTKVSRTDADAGFMVRDEKPQGFFYLDHRTVDGKYNIIVDTHATPGNVHDSQPIIKRIDRILDTFDIEPVAVGLDAGYFTAAVCHELEERQLIGVMGYRRPTKKKGYFAKREYQYDTDNDTYTCPQGQILLYKTTNREGYRHYHSDPKQCKTCPVRERCTNSQNTTKVVTRHVWQASVERANEVRLSDWGKKRYKRRSQTVERSFADAKQHHNHRYARYRGLEKVNMQCLLAAACQNMKKIAMAKKKA